MGARQLVWLVWLALALVPRGGASAMATCASGKRLGLSLTYRTNRTGHPHLQALLEQPVHTPFWRLDVELAKKRCDSAGLTTALLFNLTGSPDADWSVAAASPGYAPLPNAPHRVFRRPERAQPWRKAREECARDGGRLHVPTSPEEFDSLLHTFPMNVTGSINFGCIWLGASDFLTEGKFLTETGDALEKATSLPWKQGQPDGNKSQNCIVRCRSAGMYDENCDILLGFICSKD